MLRGIILQNKSDHQRLSTIAFKIIQEMIKLLLVILIVLLTSSSVLYNYCCFWSIRWFRYLSIHQVQMVYKGIYFEGSRIIVLTKNTAKIVLSYVSYIIANSFKLQHMNHFLSPAHRFQFGEFWKVILTWMGLCRSISLFNISKQLISANQSHSYDNVL